MKPTSIIGWDIGGAHLKAVLLNGDGQLQQVLQVPCALWQGLDLLEAAVHHVLLAFGQRQSMPPTLHAVTMTGELVDLFSNREQGVLAISRLMQQIIGMLHVDNHLLFYQVDVQDDAAHFVDFSSVASHWQDIASANWHASACLIAQKIQNGLLIDMGSTTTDFVLLANGAPHCLGLSDAGRMQSGELVYTGVVRTPLMAICQTIEFKAHTTSLAAEYFATMADVYRLTQELSPAEDLVDTADGADKSTLASARRIARMIGYDVQDATMADWRQLAEAFKAAQLERLVQVAALHIARLPKHATTKIVGAGAGSFLVKALVARLQANHLAVIYMDAMDLFGDVWRNNHLLSSEGELANRRWASICLPAYAVATLAWQQYQ